MATTKKNEETKTVLKKRSSVEDVVKEEKAKPTTDKMPLKKRELPTEASLKPEKKTPQLKKRELPEDGEVKVKKPKANPLDSPIFSKKVTEEKPEGKEKSSLDKMRERIAAQKRLEQDIMAEQALHNQEKDKLRGKLSALSKTLEEDAILEKEEKVKPNFDFDLKSEALESQNKKLKQDLEKQKQQLQSLLALEFHNMKVLDPSNFTLSNEFIEAINSIKEQADLQKDNEEQSLKDELSNLQKELSGLKAKNVAAQKASEEAQKVASQAQRAVNKAKKAIEEQESDMNRDFKKEISDLEKQVKDKTTELENLTLEKENLLKENEEKFNNLKQDLEKQVKDLNKDITLKTKEIDKLTSLKEGITKEKQDLVKENKVLSGEINKANEKIEHAKQTEIENKDLQTKLDNLEKELKDNEIKFKDELAKQTDIQTKQVNELEEKVKSLEQDGLLNQKLKEEKEALELKLDEQTKKIDELLNDYQNQLDSKSKEIDSLRSELSLKEDELLNRPTDEVVTLKNEEIERLKSELLSLEEKVNNAPSKEELDNKNQEISFLKESIQNQTEEIKNRPTKLEVENLKEEINKLNTNIDSLKEENLALTKTKEELTNTNSTLEKENEELKNTTKEIEKVETIKEVNVNDKELVEKCDQYKNLLLSERNSHLQVEQKLCKDLDNQRSEIEKLQAQIASMSENHGLTRLNQQVDVIEKFVSDMKENNKTDVNRDVYNSYYEKLIMEYKEEQEKFILEIEKRNKMLSLLRDEKLNIVEILKRNGKNTSVLEQQIQDINTIINKKVETNEVTKTEVIEEEILNNIKDDLIKYCDNVKRQALKDLEEIDNKYNNATNVSNLIKDYNDDCDSMTHLYGDEIVRLNLERELNKDENKQKAIEEKILILDKQYKTLTQERDLKFNEALTKIRKQSFDITKEQLETNYFAFVGEEYMKSLNQYSVMKQKVLEKIDNQNKKYEEAVESLKLQEDALLKENQEIKSQIVSLNEKENLEETEKLAKNQLYTSLKNNELKIENIKEYGFIQTEKDHKFILSKLEEDLKNIIDEEKKLKELYEQRERDAKNRLEIEKITEEEQENLAQKKLISDYVYIEGEADRVILSVDETRQELLDAQEALDEIKDSKLQENKQDQTETVNTNQIRETKENYRIPQDDNVVVKEVKVNDVKDVKEDTTSNTNDLKTLEENKKDSEPVMSRIRIEDDLGQKDLLKIKELQDEINDLKYKLNENEESYSDLNEKYDRFVGAEEQMSNDFKDVIKYKSALKDHNTLKEITESLDKEILLMDVKQDKKAYKVKAAELKSFEHKKEYLEKIIKSLSTKKQVKEYIQVVEKIEGFEKEINEYDNRNKQLRELIESRESEIEALKH